MEYMPVDLRHYIQVNTLVSLTTVITTIRLINIALSVMKKSKLVHLDVKPENILVQVEDNKKKLYLSDFGHSLEFSESLNSLYCCSRNYRSPELLLGLEFDYQTDIFSLGVVALELLLG